MPGRSPLATYISVPSRGPAGAAIGGCWENPAAVEEWLEISKVSTVSEALAGRVSPLLENLIDKAEVGYYTAALSIPEIIAALVNIRHHKPPCSLCLASLLIGAYGTSLADFWTTQSLTRPLWQDLEHDHSGRDTTSWTKEQLSRPDPHWSVANPRDPENSEGPYWHKGPHGERLGMVCGS